LGRHVGTLVTGQEAVAKVVVATAKAEVTNVRTINIFILIDEKRRCGDVLMGSKSRDSNGLDIYRQEKTWLRGVCDLTSMSQRLI
jgi:hypothetical protein